MLIIWLVLTVLFHPSRATSVQLTLANFDSMVATHEVVFLNFYADWCRFSQILAPVFDEAADKLAANVTDKGKALFGKVDCDAENALSTRFHITKYPTLKLIRQGFVAKREYRGQRSAEAIATYIHDQLKDPVQEMNSAEDFQAVEDKKRLVIAYFERKETPLYDVYRRVAMNLRDDCDFAVAIGEPFQAQRSTGDRIMFRPPYAKDGARDRPYSGNLNDFSQLNTWATENCIPLVREITFENAEELTEEGLPFLILFHHPDDHEIVDKYTQQVQTQLIGDKSNVNYLTADGVKFAHPLHHLGKSMSDLPLIAIDSFRHMYLFPNVKEMTVTGKLKQFVDDLYSGKLHREFHYGPDATTENKDDGTQDDNTIQPQQGDSSTPPESTFRKLAPSRNRYTLLRDEL